jgi:hypothetical protein
MKLFTVCSLTYFLACLSYKIILLPREKSDFIVTQNKANLQSKNDLPAVINLPFGPRVKLNRLSTQGRYFENLIYYDVGRLIKDEGFTKTTLKDIKLYPMPKIVNMRYVKITAADSLSCDNGKPFDKMLEVRNYRYRLPDYGRFKVFYSCNYDYFGKDQAKETRKSCSVFLKTFYGYLTIYDPVKQSANVINIYFSSFSDGLDLNRHFFIDKKFNIHLVDFAQDSDDEEISKPVVGKRYLIRISLDGKINVNQKK